MTMNEVPARVREAFARGYDVGQVTKVERTTLMSRCTGYPSKFRFPKQDKFVKQNAPEWGL